MNPFPLPAALFLSSAIASASPLASDVDPESAAAALGLARVDLVEVGLSGAPGAPALVRFEHGGVEHRLDLAPRSIRAEGYRLIEQTGPDRYVDLPTGPALTYRGRSSTLPGARVAAGWLDDGLHARILFPGGESLWLEPLAGRVDGAGYFDYALYRDADRRDAGHTCEVDAAERGPRALGATPQGPPVGAERRGGTPLTAFAGGFKVAEVGVDTDFEFYESMGSISASQDLIETVLNAVNLQYEGDVGITHKITTVIIRTTANDPYTTSNPGPFLGQFRNHWQSQQQSIQRDVAHLFSGKNLDGSVIGVAYLGTVCSNSGYGLVQSGSFGSMSTKTDLSAHELGHNWDANHCSCPGFTMNPSLTAANQFNPTATIPEIVSFSNQIGCLDTGPSGSGSTNPILCTNEAYGVGDGVANIGTLFSIVQAVIGREWVGSFTGFNGFSSGFLVAALSPASLPYGDGVLLVDVFNPIVFAPVASFFGNGAGVVPIPDDPGLIGATMYTQVGIVDPAFAGGYALSNGLAVSFCE